MSIDEGTRNEIGVVTLPPASEGIKKHLSGLVSEGLIDVVSPDVDLTIDEKINYIKLSLYRVQLQKEFLGSKPQDENILIEEKFFNEKLNTLLGLKLQELIQPIKTEINN